MSTANKKYKTDIQTLRILNGGNKFMEPQMSF